MFTGIIEDVGEIKNIQTIQNGIRLTIQSILSSELKEGDSVATNGACLTVTNKTQSNFSVDVSFETIKRTNLGKLNIGSKVNLERALKLSERLDGHIVLGHVDTTATVENITKTGDFYILSIKIDDYTFNHSVEKGSICIDGISLTIADLQPNRLTVAIIPFTFEHTNLKFKKPSDTVNIETDIIGKYVEKFTKTKSNQISEDFLKEHGFI